MIHERYRPQTWAEVVGNERAVLAVKRLCDKGLGGQALWISAISGVGKTTLARIAAATIADPLSTREYVARDLTVADLNRIGKSLHMYGMGKLWGRAVIINEAHGLNSACIEVLLDLLEPIPRHVVWIFTTTRLGETKLLNGEIDGGPLYSRCVPIALSNQGLAKPFAARFLEVARSEGFEIPATKAMRVIQDCSNNLRAAYGWLGSPEALDYLVESPTAAVAAA